MSPAWVGTSWKMNKTLAEARDYAARLAVRSTGWPDVQPFIIPPATALSAVAQTLGPNSPVLLGAQNAHWEPAGAWTGEVSMAQVADAGAQLVEIGHSERRRHFGETDETVNLKTRAALDQRLRPLVCVGESEDVFESGGSVDYVCAQAAAALEGIQDPAPVLIAYEPVWAIGDTGREAKPDDVAPVFAALTEQFGATIAGLLYGGSVNLANAGSLLDVGGVAGLFIGRAAWDADDFIRILDTVAEGR